ncbi:MAG: adenine phosphoribosyltransferase [Verrucomicrobiota bacterium]
MSSSVVFRSAVSRLEQSIRTIPDFPKPGIQFRDITPILSDGQLFRLAITVFAERYQRRTVDKIVAIDARGFLFGGALAHLLGVGLVPVRKKGKLPYQTHSAEYELEYGTDSIQIHTDAVQKGERVIILDDLLATGGTAAAAVELVDKCGGSIIELAFLIELADLHGRDRLRGQEVFSAIRY